MPDNSFELAKRCPKCNMPGAEVSQIPTERPNGRGKAVIHLIKCVNEGRCVWADEVPPTTWIVQVNQDGTIPTFQAGPKKSAAGMERLGRYYLEEYEEDLRRTKRDSR